LAVEVGVVKWVLIAGWVVVVVMIVAFLAGAGSS